MLHAKERGGEDVIKNAAFVKRRGEQLFQHRFGTHTQKHMKHQQLLFDWQCIAKWIVRHSGRVSGEFNIMTCKSVVPSKMCHNHLIDTAFPSETPIYAANRERGSVMGQPITPHIAFFGPSIWRMGRSCPQDKMIHLNRSDAEGDFWHFLR